MKVFKTSYIFDFVLGTSVLFFIIFVWTRYFLHDFWLTIIISAGLTFLTASVYQIVTAKKNKRKSISKQELNNAESISTGFLLSPKQEILKHFFDKLNAKYNTKIKSDFLLVNDKVLKPIYNTQIITDKEVVECYLKTKDLNVKKIIITCKKADESCYAVQKLITDKEIIILNEYEAYENIFKPLQFEIPNFKIIKTKKNLSYYLNFALNKSKSKNYFFVSIFLLFASFVLRYNLYYIAFASITGMLGLYSYFNTKFNKTDDKKYI